LRQAPNCRQPDRHPVAEARIEQKPLGAQRLLGQARFNGTRTGE